MVRALYRASQAGVDTDLIVRGISVLKAGVPNVSERIRVRSIVGRFLEHSRIYYFANGGQPELFIGSADLMERNLDRRVETLCRISDGEIARHLHEVVLATYLQDTERAYVLESDQYRRVRSQPGHEPVDSQRTLLEWYNAASPREDL
jgi:polyphosphate kinase